MKDLLLAAEEGRLNDVQSLLDRGRCKVDDEDEVCSRNEWHNDMMLYCVSVLVAALGLMCTFAYAVFVHTVAINACVHSHYSTLGCLINMWLRSFWYESVQSILSDATIK